MPEDLWRPDVVLWAGPRSHFVHYPLRRGELYNLVAVFHSDHYEEGWNAEGSKDLLWQHFKGLRPEVLRLLERIETWRMWVLCDREPVKDWSKGRVTLLGDAAHPMLQYLAQGACMATEDAVVLAEKVAATPDDPAGAFKAYQQERYLRTARTQIMARVYGEFYHARGVTAELRDMAVGGRTTQQSLRRHRLALWRAVIFTRPAPSDAPPADRAARSRRRSRRASWCRSCRPSSRYWRWRSPAPRRCAACDGPRSA